MSQRYNDNTKRPKPQDTQLKMLVNSVGASGPAESTAGVKFLLNIIIFISRILTLFQNY